MKLLFPAVISLCLALAAPAALAPARLKVSDNRRFLVTGEGKPFFWLGDTAWELFHRLNREQAAHYLQTRAAQGFTVIQAVALAEFDGLNAPSAYGEKPLIENDPARPNEAYFKHVDFIVAEAAKLGLTMGFLPTWGDKWNKKWGAGPEIFNPENARVYGEWLGRRYKDQPLVWIVGGDRPLEKDAQVQIVRAMAEGLRKGDGGAHLITFHPSGGSGSADKLHNEAWLDFNMRQNGHVIDFTERYAMTRKDYDRAPVKPVLDGEPIYEDHPVSFDAKKFGHSIAADVRRPLYWNLFTGAFGHTYGNHCVWQMFGEGREPVNNPLLPWEKAILQPGARQMQHARWLLESRPFLSRIPDDSIIISSKIETEIPGAGTRRFVATRDADGSYAMVYFPVSKACTVRMDVIKGATVKAWWFSPRDGSAQLIGEFPNTGTREFAPADLGEALDWVLVLDDAGKGFLEPGKRN